jgi:hypothetical protein
MTYDEWLDHYKPIKNHIETNASMDGFMFETFDAELDYVRSRRESLVWTIVDGDDGNQYLVDGFHYVNRQGYMIASRLRGSGVSLEINLDEG